MSTAIFYTLLTLQTVFSSHIVPYLHLCADFVHKNSIHTTERNDIFGQTRVNNHIKQKKNQEIFCLEYQVVVKKCLGMSDAQENTSCRSLQIESFSEYMK